MNDKFDDAVEQKTTLSDVPEEGTPTNEPPPIKLTDRINMTMANAKVQYDKLQQTEPMNTAWPLIHLLLQTCNDLNFLVSKQGEVIKKLDTEAQQIKSNVGDVGLSMPLSGRSRPTLVNRNGGPLTSKDN